MSSVATMKANVFRGVNSIGIEEVRRPRAVAGAAVIRITLTTICGTDLHILRGEYPVKPRLVIGHEPVGVIEELGEGVTGYKVGERSLIGAITPCGQCLACLAGHHSQSGHGEGYEAIGGWRFGNTIDGCRPNIFWFPTPEPISQRFPMICGRTGGAAGRYRLDWFFRRRVRRNETRGCGRRLRSGPDWIVCTSRKLMGASLIIGVDADARRLEMSRRMGADIVLNPRECDVVGEVMRLTGGVNVAIEALGTQETFESCLRCLRCRWNALEPRRLFWQTTTTLSGVRRGIRRSSYRHHPLPRRQKTDAPPHQSRALRPLRSDAAADTFVFARGDRQGVRAVRQPAQGCAEGRHPAVEDHFPKRRMRAGSRGWCRIV